MADADTILIIGAGQAGAVAAATLRELGHEGAITLVGQEAHAPYERPPLSKDALQTADAHGRTSVHPEDFYERQRITLLTGTEVVRIDAGRRIARLADGRDLPYSRCLLATGGRARELPGLPRGTPGVHYIRTLDDAAALRASRPDTRRRHRRRLPGPGSGVHRACAGAEVTVLESAPRLLERVLPRHCRTGWPNAPATPAWTCAWARALPAATASRKRTPPSGARRAFSSPCRMPAPWRPTSWWWPSA